MAYRSLAVNLGTFPGYGAKNEQKLNKLFFSNGSEERIWAYKYMIGPILNPPPRFTLKL